MQQITLTDQADQSFGIVVGTQRISMRLRYSTVSERWSFDLSVDDVPIIHGRRIVCGADLLAPFGLGIGGLVAYAVTEGSEPGRQELVDGRVGLFFLTEEELA